LSSAGFGVAATSGDGAPASGPVSLSQKPSHDEIWATTDGVPEDNDADALPAGMTPPPTDIEELAEWTAAIVRESDREAVENAKDAEREIGEIGALQPEIEAEDDTEPANDAPLADDGEAIQPPALAMPPERPDDFKLIKGIGPAFEKRLNEFGIYRYSQIARWSEAEQLWIGQEFGFTGRIERDDWVGQAAALAEAAKAEDPALN
jgi:predicted flap endonuclease-1-like 5' DNA nuclease